MKRYLMMISGMLALFMCLFFPVEALGVPLLVDPTPWLNRGGVWAAANFQSTSLMFVFVLLITGIFRAVGRRVMPDTKSARP